MQLYAPTLYHGDYCSAAANGMAVGASRIGIGWLWGGGLSTANYKTITDSDNRLLVLDPSLHNSCLLFHLPAKYTTRIYL